ncbi:MAG: hypothetical protein AAF288_13635 [Planctomycetota bacterium]
MHRTHLSLPVRGLAAGLWFAGLIALGGPTALSQDPPLDVARDSGRDLTQAEPADADAQMSLRSGQPVETTPSTLESFVHTAERYSLKRTSPRMVGDGRSLIWQERRVRGNAEHVMLDGQRHTSSERVMGVAVSPEGHIATTAQRAGWRLGLGLNRWAEVPAPIGSPRVSDHGLYAAAPVRLPGGVGLAIGQKEEGKRMSSEVVGPFAAMRWPDAVFGPGQGNFVVPVQDRPGGGWRLHATAAAHEQEQTDLPTWTDLRPAGFLRPSGRPVFTAFQAGRWRVMTGDEPVGEAMAWIEAPVPAPAADRLGWWARDADSGRWALVIDGARVGVGSAVRPAAIRWSPDASTWAVVVDNGSTMHLAHAFGRDEACEDIAQASLTLSPVGGRIAYAARQGDRWFVVLDGEPGRAHDEIDPASLRFAPDGARLTYAARDGVTHWRLFDADRPGEGLGGFVGSHVSAGSMRVNPKDGRLASAGLADGQAVLLIDGDPVWSGPGVGEPAWSPDGTVLACPVLTEAGWRLWVDGRVSEDALASLLPGSRPWFDAESQQVWVWGALPAEDRSFGKLIVAWGSLDAGPGLVAVPTD